MNVVFPKVTKCTFHKYGPSGTVTRHDVLCILALNIINEKIYVFLWFWFVGVAIMSGLAIVYRMVVILVPSLRVSVICARALNQVPRSTVKALISSKSGWLDQVGDYWVIYLLSKNLTDPMMIINKGDRSDRIQFIKKYFKESMKSHGPYAMKFFFCEFLCLVNVIGQMYFTDRFLGYTFMTYGSDVFAMTFGDPEGRSDPMNMVFPKVTKCTFHKYGPSGTVTRHDGLCILALNIINEKIYVFLWFWFVGVAIM